MAWEVGIQLSPAAITAAITAAQQGKVHGLATRQELLPHHHHRHLLGCGALWPGLAVVHQLRGLADVLPDLVHVPLLKLAAQQLLVPLARLAVAPNLALAGCTHDASKFTAGLQLQDSCQPWLLLLPATLLLLLCSGTNGPSWGQV